jgi:hypothetical protein
MEPKRYATAAAFRRAREDRLQDIAAKESVDLQRLRRQVAFDRFLTIECDRDVLSLLVLSFAQGVRPHYRSDPYE